jgi:hypothetical protein
MEENRGRIQAQGKNLEESEAWSQNEPPTVEKGLEMLKKLREKIPKKEAEIREKAFDKMERLIKNAQNTNGIDAPANVSFRAEGYAKERLDLEVKKGKAFIKKQNEEEEK